MKNQYKLDHFIKINTNEYINLYKWCYLLWKIELTSQWRSTSAPLQLILIFYPPPLFVIQKQIKLVTLKSEFNQLTVIKECYNPMNLASGVFTAPASAITIVSQSYMFNALSFVHLRVNGVVIGESYTPTNYYNMSLSASVNLKKGD